MPMHVGHVLAPTRLRGLVRLDSNVPGDPRLNEAVLRARTRQAYVAYAGFAGAGAAWLRGSRCFRGCLQDVGS